jgi:hypothetical protein
MILTRHVPAYRAYVIVAALLLVFAGIIAASLYSVNESRRRAQTQVDSHVATVWILGVAQGAQTSLTHGTTLQKWLNAHGIHALGDYRVLTSRYSGDHDGLEIWFDYRSYLPEYPQLECHRIGATAFIDDLGQEYHGYLDFQDKYVGVYLPGYDHAAHRLTCALHWMPRKPAPAHPVSAPMVFTVDLPPARRILPDADTLGHGPVTVTRQGITVTAGGARLEVPDYSIMGGSQRELTFRLKIQGGEVASSNVDTRVPTTYTVPGGVTYRLLRNGSGFTFYSTTIRRQIVAPNVGVQPTTTHPFTITDPYGISLLSDNEFLRPRAALDGDEDPLQTQYGTAWVAPVNGAGQGTDVVRLHFEVLPTLHTPRTAPVPFDILLPVQTGGEV